MSARPRTIASSLPKFDGLYEGRIFFALGSIYYDPGNHLILMSYPQHSPAVSALQLTAELAWASWETVMHRTMMMAQGTCSLAEYQSMVDEKTAAALEIGGLLFSANGASAQALLTPWHSRATANAKRLRR